MAEHFDVLIVGAGLSGIGAARHLKTQCPGKTFAILEGRDTIGGTWDLFRYPGIRSDSDMYTLGYNFKPWTEKQVIADGHRIRHYIQETASENDIQRHIRFGSKVTSADWRSETATWTVTVQKKSGETVQLSCNWLMMCSGYYNYEEGFTPEFKGREDFKGQVIHPQFWPENLDYSGKRVVVIGSGATAITLIPSMTDKARMVTMLQRTPSYVISVPQFDPMVRFLLKFLPEMTVYNISRARNNFITQLIFKLSRKYPNAVRKFLLKQVKMQVGPNFDMKHFTPPYNPWDQRLCAVPNGDMFKAIKRGKANVVTDHIDRFVGNGIKLKSGQTLEADIIVTATGLNLRLFGGMTMSVDGKAIEMNQHISYKGLMFSDIPNFSNTLGYTNASWTLKADLIAEYVCRLLKHMDKTGTRIAVAERKDPNVKPAPLLDMTSGYVARAEAHLPKGADRAPWKLYQNYALDMDQLRNGKLEDGVMAFLKPHVAGGSATAQRKAA
ncbi:flavin-containing monooxygenase [Aquabacterium parvum]|jgi:cation diffusion facilitator CzcD-associated flavoprotein CzcO|uniref:flavin-containing monooxygenase n=1 Tax=Aquabacterium parvum TaxID=70584 RepID=UPI000718C6CE|nr:NAD(P)/FAD-dependent oxidoreductase [Aquabacterium parvum]MBU0916758.1 NAD(P)/FAD-dependent oxidoreductase [Gammaproteobacteria bacterium]